MIIYDNIINFYKEYIKLEQIIRKGWIMRNIPVDRLESVADHTLQLLMLASIITKELNIDLDLTRLMEMLLIHDLGEIIIGDISEIEEGHDSKREKEEYAIKTILNNLSKENSAYYYDLYLEMEDQKTELAKFAYLLDKIDAVIKAEHYEKECNMNGLFNEFFTFQDKKGIFKNSILEEFFNFLNEKYNNSIN